jgi:hypothetical protein
LALSGDLLWQQFGSLLQMANFAEATRVVVQSPGTTLRNYTRADVMACMVNWTVTCDMITRLSRRYEHFFEWFIFSI